MLSIKHDLAKLERKLGRMGQGMVPKAASQAINRTAKSVNSKAVKEVAAETGVKQKEIRQAHQLYLANRSRLQATVNASKAKAKNLIAFVPPAQRKPNHFNARTRAGKYKAPGVKARAWGKSKTYRGTFIQRASNGKLLVLKRKATAGPRGGTTEGVAGPSPRGTFAGERLQQVMQRQARERMGIELTRSINNELRRLRK